MSRKAAVAGDTHAAMAGSPRPSAVYLVVGALSWPVLRGLFRLRARGVEHLPREGGYVLAANHWSNFDPWPLGVPLFPRRYLRFMAKSELFWFPLGAFITAGGAFPVRRGQQDLEAIDTAVLLCREGHVVVMFPEGTRRAKGMRKKYEARPRSGAARIALRAGVPLVPAAVAGTDRLSRLARLRVAYGPPLDLADLEGHDERDAAATATDRLMTAIAELEGGL
jgi:1-acyl-sn-glycerol-3-phosphate acyltransferase